MINPEQLMYLESEEFIEGRDCLRLAVPWVVAESVYKLDEILEPDDVVLEFGAGGSTLFFAARCKKVYIIETTTIEDKKSPDDRVWSEQVNDLIIKRQIYNTMILAIKNEDRIVEFVKEFDTSQITVVSVDTQGGYNRGRMLDAFLDKGVSPNLRIIILDNYNHPELFPDLDSYLQKLQGWAVMDFKHPRWAGDGTRIIVKIK